jgi:hypothetical protein
MTDPKAESNFTKIFDPIHQHLKGTVNLARIKLISQAVMALCKVQSVCLNKLATGFETCGKASAGSSMRRLQRFLASYALDTDLIARMVMKLVPFDGPYQLSMDRTEWDFGAFRINILALGIVYRGCAFPVLFTMLPKKGNSNTAERVALIERFIQLFGREALGSLLADREFVGHKWVQYLTGNDIKYYIRVKESFLVHFANGDKVKGSRLFGPLKVGEKAWRGKPVTVCGVRCYLTACKVKGRDNKPELQLIISYDQETCPINEYGHRWQIETMFRGMKSSGFNLEDTHLKHIERVARLFCLVMIAYTWAYKTGVHLHETIRNIPVKSHGRRAKSYVKYGLEYLAEVLLNPFNQHKVNVFQILSCT